MIHKKKLGLGLGLVYVLYLASYKNNDPCRQSLPGLFDQSLICSQLAILLSGLNTCLHLSSLHLKLHTITLECLRERKSK